MNHVSHVTSLRLLELKTCRANIHSISSIVQRYGQNKIHIES